MTENKIKEENCGHEAIVPNLVGEGRCFRCNKFFNKKEFKKWMEEANE